jgi:GNAT superfamily N-acetyltransferase
VESVRVAGADDLVALERLAELAAGELGGERGGPLWQQIHGRVEPIASTLRADLAEAADGVGLVLVGTFADVPAGYAVAHREVLPDGTSIAVVTDVYVEPGFRGVGLGEALMDALLDWARSTGCRGIDALALPGMRHSKNFFERFGLTARAILVHRDLRGESS